MPELLQGLFPVRVNVGEEAFRSNIEAAVKLDLPWLQQLEAHEGHAVIVGGGPSLKDCKRELEWRHKQGHKFFALNNTAAWLFTELGIVADYLVLLDAKESTSRFVVAFAETHHLIASQCTPLTFELATRPITGPRNVTLWHPNIEGIQEYVGDRECALIGGGTTVGLQAIDIACQLGYRSIHLFGFDSSYRGDDGHAYDQPENYGEDLIDVFCAGKKYRCARWMIRQVEEFKGVAQQLVDLGCEITVSGSGFLQSTFAEMLKTVLTAVYDLAVSPPTYDFLSFLCAAEKARIEGGHAHLDVVFMPGPVNGFREDNLPPSPEARAGMLHRICVSACRLLPSVRNVWVCRQRSALEGAIFPEGWTVLTPVSHYGGQVIKDGLRALKATASAREAIRKRYNSAYVTITLRNSSYWPSRNSDSLQWAMAAEQFKKLGYGVVMVYDAETHLHAPSWDIDLRLALYEGAACNLLTCNGPAALLILSECPYLLFKMLDPECPSTTVEFYERQGIKVGDQFGPNGRTIWQDDNADTIIEAFTAFVQPLEQERAA